jgi:hypothetical protein
MGTESNRKALEIAEKNRGYVYPALGYHPWEIKEEEVEKNLSFIRDHAGECVALGEIGLDYKIKVKKELQWRVFGEILDEPSLKEEVIGIVQEIYAIALKKNIGLPDGIVDLSLKKATMFPRDTQTSLQKDIHQKKGKSELELFGGTIIDLGKKLGIPTPTTNRIYLELGGIEPLR